MTLEELEKLEESEHELALSIVALFLVVGDSYTKKIRDLVGGWFRKYSENGTYTYQQARRILTKKELREFNKEMGTDFKRLTRQRALRYRIQGKLADMMVEGTKYVEQLAEDISVKENTFFNSSESTDGIADEKWGADNGSPKSRFNARIIKNGVKLQNEVERVMFTTGNANDAEKASDGEMSTLLAALALLLTTEGTAMSSIMRRRIFKGLKYSRYKYVALRDEVTCETCGALHGTIFPLEVYEVGVTASPMHPRCRCIEVPVFDV